MTAGDKKHTHGHGMQNPDIPPDLCPRLIDYLVIVGARRPGNISRPPSLSSSNEATSSTVQNPELLRRYPLSNHKDFPLPTDVTLFCQPEGCVSMGPRRITFRDTTSFVFALTDKDHNKTRYGICVNFYRTSGVHKASESSTGDGHTLNSSGFGSGDTDCTMDDSGNQSKRKRKAGTCKRRKCQTLTSLCLISHHPFFSTFRNTMLVLKKLIHACNIRSGTKQSGYSKIGKDSVWSALTGQMNDANIPGVVMHEIRELETWILHLLSAPVPVPGKTRVHLSLLPEALQPPLVFALPDHTRFSLVDFPLHLPLELLGVDAVIKVLTCVMLEYKVVLQSRDYNALSMCVMSFVTLMYPLEYMFPIIPLLPAYMANAEQLLLAPTPYIIGVPASFFHAKKMYKLPNDVVLVDLDANRVILPDGMRFPQMPQPDYQCLVNHFKQALSNLSSTPEPIKNLEDLTEADCHKLVSNQQQLQHHNGNPNGNPYGNDTDAVDVATRVAMVRFFNSTNILSNFTEHTRTLRLYPRPVVALQCDTFLRSRPQANEFINELAKTQAVEYFAEWSLCPKNEAWLRVQTGTADPAQVGDKAKWFAHNLSPVEFSVHSENSSLGNAWQSLNGDRNETELTDESGGSGSEDVKSTSSSLSSLNDLVFQSPSMDFDPLADFGRNAQPLGDVNDVYNEPLTLELPGCPESLNGSSPSSGRSSPTSSLSTGTNLESETELARLAENLALKNDFQIAFNFKPTELCMVSDETSPTESDCTPQPNRRPISTPANSSRTASASNSSTPTSKTPTIKQTFKAFNLGESTDGILGPTGTHIFSALGTQLNDYVDKSQNVLTDFMHKTAPAAQKLKDKTINPFPMARKGNLVDKVSMVGQSSGSQSKKSPSQRLVEQQQAKVSTEKAAQQNKNQQAVKDMCDAVIAGQGISVWSGNKLKRLMEDESLRALACARLNMGLDKKHASEDEPLETIPITRAQFKGYARVLQSCVQGIELSYYSPASSGLASTLHVLEIAHTHYWSKELEGGSSLGTPGSSGLQSLISTPSPSMHDLTTSSNGQRSNRCQDDTPTGQFRRTQDRASTRSENSIPVNNATPRARPARPPPPRQESIIENSKVVANSLIQSKEKCLTLEDKTLSEQSDCSTLVSQASSGSPSSGSEGIKASPNTLGNRDSLLRFEMERVYLYTEITGHTQIWNHLPFWEDVFYDATAQERDIVGLDQEPSEMMERYSSLCEADRKRLEMDEDRLLTTGLHNMAAFMLMCGTPKMNIQQKIRRMLGKAHVGLTHSKKINELLDDLISKKGNEVTLRPTGSRLMQKQSFSVHQGADASGDMMFMEVCDDAIIVRGVSGVIIERWWYEKLVNMTYSPKTKVLCLWRKNEGRVLLHKFYTKKCRDLYNCIKLSMERAAERGKLAVPGKDLGGEFPVQDFETNQGGLLQVRIDGIALVFSDRKCFIELSNIKKCNTSGGNTFIIEEYDRAHSLLIQRKYLSQMADQICYAVLCVFSYVAAQSQAKNIPHSYVAAQSQAKNIPHSYVAAQSQAKNIPH